MPSYGNAMPLQTEAGSTTWAQLRELWLEAEQLLEDSDVCRRLTALTSLETALQKAVGLIHMLRNEQAPIHRLPPEIMTRIFSLVRRSCDDPALTHQEWSFPIYDDRKLHPLLLVCRRWRELTLNTPLLWSHVMSQPGIDDSYLARSASMPLTVYISRDINMWTTPLPHTGGSFSHSSSPSSFYKTLKSFGKVHSRVRELYVNFRSSGVPPYIPGFLATFGAGPLEHCSIEYPNSTDGPVMQYYSVPDPVPRLRLFAGGWGNTGGEKLRSLALSAVPFLPSNRFPSLKTFSLSKSTSMSNRSEENTKTWGLGDLVDFLSGSPMLEELSIRNVQLELRRLPSSRNTTVTLNHLRRFVLETPHYLPMHGATLALSLIAYPINCHVFLTTFLAVRHGTVDQLLMLLPYREQYTRLRIGAVNWNDGSSMLQFIPASRCGSLSIGLLVRIALPHQAYNQDADPQRELRALFGTAYPWCGAIEELWLELAEEDYCEGIRCVLGRFQGLRRLVVCQPCWVNPGGCYARIDDALRLLRPARNGTVACPSLETLCINIPAYSKDVEAVRQVIWSRAESYPVRRLVVGYSPVLELEVLAELFALGEIVEEFVCEELPPVGRETVPSDWLLSIPKVFEDGAFHADWPKWDKSIGLN
ncbi:hypothetical protein L226DRAFT_135182 [Lentinus tigrinus ALCF2SS1-7]|uniref:F-box domain-containing protein n=1 Tax=Lentinus tigrinus ALCF2SS1-6 TaxID=1328759 RepID=A0A5C2SU40_9APHY|nr:hypothetical protein L227DRAFT_22967 [Lentinus tigrinus ALCF2SS1-6]RPD81324.1 hypothetical protein L226DRAFT_135182 [Lentinus tigrinus ALCF2SS1-7]